MARFHKYQALGNDYLVLEEPGAPKLEPKLVRRICDRHFGIGSDGILAGRAAAAAGRFVLRIFNPDGSEAEKSGNGLRIFARYLWDTKQVGGDPFVVETKGGEVSCRVLDEGRSVCVEMGAASFDSAKIPVAGPKREVVDEAIDLAGERLRFTGVTVGNPHCVVMTESPTPEFARRLGPLLECHPSFPNRTNVQFMKVLGRHRIRIEIWERGAGYTLASGSSSCAAAAAAVRQGFCSDAIAVEMPGGTLDIRVSKDFAVTMTGPARKVAHGELAQELLDEQQG